ncbi:MAG: hypothetical protein DCC73_00430 [Proteobacteria bacterium]|nr:MAG: hypothetical protein DCC73_00430 [Pseudomonadota bacterium]
MNMHHNFTYAETLAASERVNWRLEDLIGPDKTLDFSKPFMPDAFARVQGMDYLSPREKLILNQIRGHNYLYIFGLVEEFILPFVLDHARPHLQGDDYRVRAFLNFASEEAKHIHLFKRFREEFENGFGISCDVIGPPEEIAKAVLAHDPLSVALVILHIEWMTQRHYVDSIKDNGDLDPQFKSLLKHHWMEEAQHAKLDTLMVETIAKDRDADGIAKAIDGYLEIGMLLDGGLKQQTIFDVDAFCRAAQRRLDAEELEAFVNHQHQAMRWTFLGTGMSHRRFLQTVESLAPAQRARLEGIVPAFS